MARVLKFVTRCLAYLGALALYSVAFSLQTYATVQDDQLVLIGADAASATNLQVHANCDRVHAGQPLAKFAWTEPEGVKSRQRVDITPFRGGFKAGKFETIGITKSGNPTLEWRGGEAGINYYWRVVTLTPKGWAASETARYEVPTCPVDFEKRKDRVD